MKYAAKRIAMLLVTMVIVSLLAFVAFDLISGDPATAMLGTAATPEKVAALRAELGLDRPLLVRYGEWLVGFFTGNLGISYSYGQPVWELISSKVLVTLVLSLMSFVLIVAVSIPLGLRSAVGGGKLEGVRDGVRTVINQLCMAVPPFFTGILLSWLFGTVLHWFIRPVSRLCTRPLGVSGIPAVRGNFPGHSPHCHDHPDAPGHDPGGAAKGLCPDRHLPGQ